jgi:hypothetical protein
MRGPATGAAGAGRPVWHSSGAHLLFHYTYPRHAERVHAERIYRVSEQQHQRRGSGLFLTNSSPGARTDDELLKLLFAYRRPIWSVHGVVVLRRNEVELPIVQFGPGKWMHAAERRSEIDLSLVLIGYGRKNPYNDEWAFSPGCYV